MQAMLLEGPAPIRDAPLRQIEVARPRPAAGELVLKVLACAICRTDLQIVEGDIPAQCLPIVPGHQVIGVVAEVGRDVSGWREGETAGIGWLGGACGSCEFCAGGRENLCETARFTGWHRDGGYAEFVSVRADFALRIPAGLTPVQAAPLLCGGVIGYRSLRRSGIEPGGRLGLYGYGASARLAIQVARHWGCEVYVCTRSVQEQQQALEAGAAWAGGYDDAMPHLLDAAVTFAPVGDVVIAALRQVRRGGVVAINAIHLDRIPQFSYDLMWPERDLRSVANYTRQDAEEFLDLAREAGIATPAREFPLTQANEALLLLSEGKLPETGVLIPAASSA